MTQISESPARPGLIAQIPYEGPRGPGRSDPKRQTYAVKDLELMFSAMTVSAVLVALWKATFSPEQALDPEWERHGSFAGLVLFVLAAVALH